MPPIRLFNSLTRTLEPFVPVHPGTAGDPNDPPEARVYSCGPTVYNYQHIGNMRAYIFADTLGRALSAHGFKLTHVINITDVGHLTSDADFGDDKLEKAAALAGKSAWDVAKFYTDAFKADVAALNIRPPAHWSVATDYVPAMLDYAQSIADKHCYELGGGLYFDTSTVADYGRLARAVTESGEGRIAAVDGKRHAADFAIWRKTPPHETRQMEWDSPWGRGAPGWHLECSVMSAALLGLPFDIHTGGIDHREIHHPNEIAQNQAHAGCDQSGANIWMHNNFLVERGKGTETGKMSKSSGDFLRLQVLIDKGFHPLSFRLLCLQAHYRSELEFSWENLAAAQTRLKRIVALIDKLRITADDRAGLRTSEGFPPQAQALLDDFHAAVADDLNTVMALTVLDTLLDTKALSAQDRLITLGSIDRVLGLNLVSVTRADLRIRPVRATLTESKIATLLAARTAARTAKDYAASDRIRDHLSTQGVEVMDGDPLGWDWKLNV